jgi:hypothetical protein
VEEEFTNETKNTQKKQKKVKRRHKQKTAQMGKKNCQIGKGAKAEIRELWGLFTKNSREGKKKWGKNLSGNQKVELL